MKYTCSKTIQMQIIVYKDTLGGNRSSSFAGVCSSVEVRILDVMTIISK